MRQNNGYYNQHSKESVILLPASRIFCESQVLCTTKLNKCYLYMDGNFPAARRTPLGTQGLSKCRTGMLCGWNLELGSPSFYHAPRF